MKKVCISPEELKDCEIDFENNRIITKDGKVYENVEIDFKSLEKYLREKMAH